MEDVLAKDELYYAETILQKKLNLSTVAILI
jgi:hypothetical protein